MLNSADCNAEGSRIFDRFYRRWGKPQSPSFNVASSGVAHYCSYYVFLTTFASVAFVMCRQLRYLRTCSYVFACLAFVRCGVASAPIVILYCPEATAGGSNNVIGTYVVHYPSVEKKRGRMNGSVISPQIYQDIVQYWREFPLNAVEFATKFLTKKRPDLVGFLTKRQVADTIRNSKEYVDITEAVSRRRWSGPERDVDYQQKRGSLFQLDFAYFRRIYSGAKYCLVAIDSYSKTTFFQPTRSMSSNAAAAAFRSIIARFDAPVLAVMTDRGSEVRFCSSARTYVCTLCTRSRHLSVAPT